MSLSKYTWELYKQSTDGRAAIQRTAEAHAKHFAPNLGDQPFDGTLAVMREDDDGESYEDDYAVEDVRELIGERLNFGDIATQEAADDLLTSIVTEGAAWDFEDDIGTGSLLYGCGEQLEHGYSRVITSIAGLTTGLHVAFPDYFFPYLFARRFNEFRGICDRFGIEVPELPGKMQKRERALYYVALNRQLQDFRARMEMTPHELNAFLYDFAPRDLAESSAGDLPAPSRIWLVMGGIGDNGDFEFLDEADATSVSHWQGNLETRRGDTIVIWCVSPRSYVHSIWCATHDGYLDPYFYFYSTIRVGHPIRVPEIRFAELKSHPVFASHPAVRAHFQGRNGMAFTVREWEALTEMMRAKGFDTTQLPAPPSELALPDVNLNVERDVELQLVEPLLRRLGFSDSDWRYQMRVRMGRGERNVPDYVLGPDDRPGEELGVALIECKLDITSGKDRNEAFKQGKSYALRLGARVLVLAARQGIWIYEITSRGFDEDQHVFKTWVELRLPDKLAEIDRVFGKRRIDAEVTARERRHKRRQRPGTKE